MAAYLWKSLDKTAVCSCVSRDGLCLVASLSDKESYPYGRLYISSDQGVTWDEVRPGGEDSLKLWGAVDNSQDGTTILATVGSYTSSAGRVYLSKDKGVTWAEVQPLGAVDRRWIVARVSDDGNTLLIGGGNSGTTMGRLFVSTDGGSNWVERRPTGSNLSYEWAANAMSASGAVIYVGIRNGRVYKSSNYGASWAQTLPIGSNNAYWSGADTSSDGNTVILVNGTNYTSYANYYVSIDGGTNWAPGWLFGSGVPCRLNSPSMSSDGSKVLLGTDSPSTYEQGLFVSLDTGLTWELQEINSIWQYAYGRNWGTTAISGDGSFVLASETDKVFNAFINTAPILSADFSASETIVDVGFPLQFTDLTIDNIVSWLWDFGDGHTSTDRNPLYRYSVAGTFSVTLTIVNETDDTYYLTKENYVTANNAWYICETHIYPLLSPVVCPDPEVPTISVLHTPGIAVDPSDVPSYYAVRSEAGFFVVLENRGASVSYPSHMQNNVSVGFSRKKGPTL